MNRKSNAEKFRDMATRDKAKGLKVRHFKLSSSAITQYEEMRTSGLSYDDIVNLAFTKFQEKK